VSATEEALIAQVSQIAAAISANRYRYSQETRLHEGIEQVLADAEIAAVREAHLTSAERIDFLAGRIGIEVKIAGRAPDVQRQLRRYAASPDVDALVLVTTRARHRGMPREIGGKPVRVVWLSGVTG
jgi:hypothetical protein